MEWIPELMKLLSTKSMIRYLPPKGTAGFARSRVSGKRRVPLPPASTIPSTRGCKAACAAKAGSRSEFLFSGTPAPPFQVPQDGNRLLRAVFGVGLRFGTTCAGWMPSLVSRQSAAAFVEHFRRAGGTHPGYAECPTRHQRIQIPHASCSFHLHGWRGMLPHELQIVDGCAAGCVARRSLHPVHANLAANFAQPDFRGVVEIRILKNDFDFLPL